MIPYHMSKKGESGVLTIIIPCFNEESTIKQIIEEVYQADVLGMKKEVVVVDDCSSDNTYSLVKDLKKKFPIILIHHQKNSGKGQAIKSALAKSNGEVVLIQDADLEYDPREYPILLEPIISGKADVVYGSRFLGSRPHRVLYYWHSIMNKILTTFSNMLTNINLTDMETCYKVFKGDLIRDLGPQLLSKRFGFEPEITARLAKKEGVRFYEVGISYYGRTYREGKKITWKDGLKAIYQIFYYNVVAK